MTYFLFVFCPIFWLFVKSNKQTHTNVSGAKHFSILISISWLLVKMANYKLRFSRELTEEESQEIEDIMNNSDDDCEFDIDDDDDDYLIFSDDESEFDLIDAESALDDIELYELQNSIDDDMNGDEGVEEEVNVVVEEADPVEPNRGEKYVAQGKKDGTIWWSNPTENEKNRTESLERIRKESVPCCTENFVTKKEAFLRLFPLQIIEAIVTETNRKARNSSHSEENGTQKQRAWKETNIDEMMAFFGILLYSGAEKSNLVQAKDLFDKSYMPFHRAVMSLKRFEQLCRFLRFDDSRTRLDRLRVDKLAPIRHIWDLFQNNLTSAFVPSKELCIDEQLLNTKNRCSFRQFIPSKPGKYGIKIFWVVDSKLNFPVSAEIYLGMQPNNNRSPGISHDLVMRLCEKYLDIGTNITMDNFFTGLPLAKSLMERNTTLVGTIRSNKRELPKRFASVEAAKKRAVFSSAFCFSEECQLVSYISHSKKNVLLLTTAHATEKVDQETKKPVVILDYNEHKGGVDTFDQMLRCFTCKRKSNRWPMVVFYNMLDVAALAAFRLFDLCNSSWNTNKSEKRKIFLKELALELSKKHLENRCKEPLKKSVKIAMNLIGFDAPKKTTAPISMPEVQVRLIFELQFEISIQNI